MTSVEKLNVAIKGWYVREVCTPAHTNDNQEAWFTLKLGRKMPDGKIEKKTVTIHGTELGWWITGV